MEDETLVPQGVPRPADEVHPNSAPLPSAAAEARSIGDGATFAGANAVGLPEHPSGTIIDHRYEIKSLLGSGGMGRVYKAWDHRLLRAVALKRLLNEGGYSATLRERFIREAKTVASMSHPGIVQLFDYGDDQYGPFIVMELLDGQDLLRIVQRDGPLDPGTVLSIADQLCGSLSHIHSSGFVHRDIKPSNLFRLASGHVKLLDFGLVTSGQADHQLSVVGLGMGTADYASPEQSSDARNSDPRDDLYSLGATLGFLLTGKPPRFLKDRDLPEGMREAIMKLLEYRRSDRYASVAEFQQALHLGTRATSEPVKATPEAKAPSRHLACVHCGAMNEYEASFCSECRQPANDNCYQCGTPDRARSSGCIECGAELTAFRNALRHVDRANAKVGTRDWRAALVELQAASRLHDAIPGLTARLRELESKVNEVASLKQAAQERLLALDPDGAKELLRRLAELLPSTEPELVSLLEEGLPQSIALRKERDASVRALADSAREAESCGEYSAALSFWLQAQAALASFAPASEGVARCRSTMARLEKLWSEARTQAAKRQVDALTATRGELQRYLPAGHSQLSRWNTEVYLPLVALTNQVDSMLRKAAKLRAEGEGESALGVCHEALVLWPEHADAAALVTELEEDLRRFRQAIQQAERAHAQGQANAMRTAFNTAAALNPTHPLVASLRPQLAKLEAASSRRSKILMSVAGIATAVVLASWYYLGVIEASALAKAFGSNFDERTRALGELVEKRNLRGAQASLAELAEGLGNELSWDSKLESKCRTVASQATPAWLPLSNVATTLAVRSWDRGVSLGRIEAAERQLKLAYEARDTILTDLRSYFENAEYRDHSERVKRYVDELRVCDVSSAKLGDEVLASAEEILSIEDKQKRLDSEAGALIARQSLAGSRENLLALDALQARWEGFKYPVDLKVDTSKRIPVPSPQRNMLESRLKKYTFLLDDFAKVRNQSSSQDLEGVLLAARELWSDSPDLGKLELAIQSRRDIEGKEKAERLAAEQKLASEKEARVQQIEASLEAALQRSSIEEGERLIKELKAQGREGAALHLFEERIANLKANRELASDKNRIVTSIQDALVDRSKLGKQSPLPQLYSLLRQLDPQHELLKNARESIASVIIADWATVLARDPDARVRDPALRQKILESYYPWRVRDNASGIEMLLVPSTSAADAPFYMAIDELSWGAWFDVFRDYAQDKDVSVDDYKWCFQTITAATEFRQIRLRDHPAWLNRVDNDRITGALRSKQLRLPTYAEWIRASLLDQGTLKESELPEYAWIRSNTKHIDVRDKQSWYLSLPSDRPKRANDLGFFNMYGNVWELLVDGTAMGGACNSTPRECLSTRAASLDTERMMFGVRPTRDP